MPETRNRSIPRLSAGTAARKKERAERLASAMRENLKRRKQQKRARAEAAKRPS